MKKNNFLKTPISKLYKNYLMGDKSGDSNGHGSDPPSPIHRAPNVAFM